MIQAGKAATIKFKARRHMQVNQVDPCCIFLTTWSGVFVVVRYHHEMSHPQVCKATLAMR
jgi:hypothetical protein